MKTYLVGGAVRDHLLGLPIHERDYVVVGATPEEMTEKGFLPVGKDFPVFLHPQTHEEYALARTERKVSRGHQGFQFYTDPSISLEEDLKRRDLTINAIAEDETGKLIDPFNGQHDLERHILRHVSDVFCEDPLRILRVARFYAYLGKFNFQIDPRTILLMRDMVRKGALTELSDERIWQEVHRALKTDYPHRFFEVLLEIEAIPELFRNFHLDSKALKLPHSQQTALIRFAILGYRATYKPVAPKAFKDLAHLSHTKTKEILDFERLAIPEKVTLLRALDYLRRFERLELLIEVIQSLFPDWSPKSLLHAAKKLHKLDRGQINKGCKPNEIAEQIFKAECAALT